MTSSSSSTSTSPHQQEPAKKKSKGSLIAKLDPNATKFSLLALEEHPLGARFRKNGKVREYSLNDFTPEDATDFDMKMEDFNEELHKNNPTVQEDVTISHLEIALKACLGEEMAAKFMKLWREKVQFGDMVDFFGYRGVGVYTIGENGTLLKSYGEFGYQLPLLTSTLCPFPDYYPDDSFGITMHPDTVPRSNPHYENIQEFVSQIKKDPTYNDSYGGPITVDLDKLHEYVYWLDFEGSEHLTTYSDAEVPKEHFDQYLHQMKVRAQYLAEVRQRDWTILNMIFSKHLAQDVLRVVMGFTEVEEELINPAEGPGGDADDE